MTIAQERPSGLVEIGPLLGSRGPIVRYGVAAMIVLAIAAARWAAAPVMGVQAPLLPFGLGVFAVAYLCGLLPALASTALAVSTATLLFADLATPAYRLAWAGHTALFLILGALVSVLTHRLQQAYQTQSRALAEARASDQKIRLVTNALPVLIAYCDAEQRYQFNNSSYERWFGFKPAEIMDKPVKDVVGPEAYEVIKPKIEAALAGKQVHFESDVPYRDGGRRFVSAHYLPDFSHDGKVRGWFALIEDITERTRAARALEDARARLSLAMRAGRSGTFEWDIVADRYVWSDELLEVCGLKAAEFEGTHEAWLKCVHPDDAQRLVAATERVLCNGEVAVDYRVVRGDGEIRWLHCRSKTFYDTSRTPIRVLGTNFDITEQKAAEESLRDADRRKDEFLAMLAHELRNPLAAIRNAAYLLAHEDADVGVMREAGEIVERQVSNLGRLVDDLLDISRIARGLIEIKREAVDIETVLDGAVATIAPAIRRKGQKLEVARTTRRALVDGDAVRLEQVFVNLLSNASKFSEPATLIELRVTRIDADLVVSVRDEGIGIDAQNISHIFDMFMQADRSLDRGSGGLGIGLTLVKKIVELHGGTVAANSAGLGKGSEFIARLPCSQTIEVRPEAPQPDLSAQPARSVLVVEDNVDAAESLKIVLSLAGHEVVVAYDSVSALKALEGFAPDCVFADIGLPGIDGFALAGMIRAHNHGRAAYLYAISGYGRIEDRQLALASGFDGHLTKPVDPAILLRLLSQDPVAVSEINEVTTGR